MARNGIKSVECGTRVVHSQLLELPQSLQTRLILCPALGRGHARNDDEGEDWEERGRKHCSIFDCCIAARFDRRRIGYRIGRLSSVTHVSKTGFPPAEIFTLDNSIWNLTFQFFAVIVRVCSWTRFSRVSFFQIVDVGDSDGFGVREFRVNRKLPRNCNPDAELFRHCIFD